MQVNKRNIVLTTVLLCCLIVTSACNNSESESKEAIGEEIQEPKATGPVIPKAVNDFKTIMTQNPGKFSGDQYNEEAVNKELDNLPNNLSNEEYLDNLVYLLGEDYQPHYATIQAIDPTIRVNQATPEGKIPQVEKINVQILLDASGSMAGKVSGGQKMDLAKKAINSFAAGLPEEANVSLRVYGHKGSNSGKDKAVSCQSNEVVYPMSPYNNANFNSALNQFKPTGWTPLASAIQAAKKDMENENGENVQNIVYVVSDGVETCGGNPVEAAKSLTQVGVKPIVNIIGFDVDDKGQKQLKEVAQAANGEFKSVYSQKDLENYLESQKKRLETEWKIWGSSSRMEAHEIWSKKYQLLNESRLAIDKLKEKEIGRINKAVEYLTQSGKINDQIPLSEMTRKRGTFIITSTWEEFMRVTDVLNQAKKNEQERIDKQEEEGKKSL
ncbi:VWA domain-containing protein [Hazenella coriacea]|uniref:D-amino-acid dehydrogenase/Ca-activated chloride channel family protein n=1 Tax=Hazenella coriacea TaxID=1179467 RepID=A0A4R3L3Y6_9BACL|nr:VWA domain-containing protein [Hazenella coriacea]TCS94259.1 D-amino-acid dehydrogenase/Ca-activated chloride channel family protein [Hazenella coriacea]